MDKKGDDDSAGPSNGGRRGTTSRRDRKADDADEKDADVKTDADTSDGPAPKARRKRAEDAGGWMTSGGGNESRPRQNTEAAAIPVDDDPKDEPSSVNREKHFQDDNDEIMLIPDLDEDGADTDQRSKTPYAPSLFPPPPLLLLLHLFPPSPAPTYTYLFPTLPLTLVPPLHPQLRTPPATWPGRSPRWQS